MCNATLEPISTEGFSGKLVEVLNHASLSLMISIGHRTGLFDTLSGMKPSTSLEIAREANLQERYVREWLGAMTTGGIVIHEPRTGRYHLPAEHAQCLTRKNPAENMAVIMQYIAVLGSVEDEVVECFRNGGGVPYSSYKRFHEVMAEESGQTVMTSLTQDILPLADGILEALDQGIDVLDLGCGSGRAMNFLAGRFPRSRFTGFDLSEKAIGKAREQARQEGLTNVRFEVRDLSTFDEDAPVERFDLVTTFDAVHDQPRPDNLLAGIHRTLRPGGTYLMQDIAGSSHVHNNMDHPIGTMIYTISCMHCMTVSLAQGGMGLGAMWGREKALEMLQEAGFRQVEVHNLSHDFLNNYYVIRKEKKASRKVA